MKFCTENLWLDGYRDPRSFLTTQFLQNHCQKDGPKHVKINQLHDPGPKSNKSCLKTRSCYKRRIVGLSFLLSAVEMKTFCKARVRSAIMGMPPRGVDSLHVFLSQLCLQVQKRFPDRTTEWRWLMMAAFRKSATAHHALRWFHVHVGTPLSALLQSALGLLPVQLLGRASLKSSSWQIQCGCGGCGQTMGGTNGQAQHFKQRVPPHVASWQSFTNRPWDSHSSKSASHCQLASAKSMQAAILATSSHKPYRNALCLVCRGSSGVETSLSASAKALATCSEKQALWYTWSRT